MVKCKAKALCFYGGKRVKPGETVMFDGKVSDIPKYMEQVKETKETKK